MVVVVMECREYPIHSNWDHWEIELDHYNMSSMASCIRHNPTTTRSDQHKVWFGAALDEDDDHAAADAAAADGYHPL